VTANAAQRIKIGFFCGWVGLILVGSFIKVPEMKTIDKLHPDIIFHGLMYLVLAVLGVWAFRWWTLIPCLITAIGTEAVQHFLPYREMAALDFGINLAGTAVGLAIWAVILAIQNDRRKRAQSIAERID
jgi:hypothetical protein